MKKSLRQKITDYLYSLCDELRLSIEHNKNKPRTPRLHKLGSLAIVLCTVIYLLIGCFGVIKSSAADVPTDLAGHTVTISPGWTASAGYGFFSVNGILYTSNEPDGFSFSNLGVGYPNGSNGSAIANWVTFYSSDGSKVDFYYSWGDTLVFDVISGDTSNPSFISWLVASDAIIANTTPSLVTVPAGLYFLQNTYNDLRGTINFSVPFLSKSSYFSSIEFVGVENDQYVAIDYVDIQDNITDVFYASEGWQDAEYSVILIQTDTTLSADEYKIFSSAFVSFADNPDLQTLFSAGQLNGQSFGYSQGYSAGESAGYQNGFANGQAEGMSQGFMSNFFGGIVQALDALKLFGDFSVLNIIECVLGLMLALWVLKLIVGG